MLWLALSSLGHRYESRIRIHTSNTLISIYCMGMKLNNLLEFAAIENYMN